MNKWNGVPDTTTMSGFCEVYAVWSLLGKPGVTRWTRLDLDECESVDIRQPRVVQRYLGSADREQLLNSFYQQGRDLYNDFLSVADDRLPGPVTPEHTMRTATACLERLRQSAFDGCSVVDGLYTSTFSKTLSLLPTAFEPHNWFDQIPADRFNYSNTVRLDGRGSYTPFHVPAGGLVFQLLLTGHQRRGDSEDCTNGRSWINQQITSVKVDQTKFIHQTR